MALEEESLRLGAPGGPEGRATAGSRAGEVWSDRPVRVVVICDSELLTEGLRGMLSRHRDKVDVVGAVPTTSAAEVADLAAEVALVDVDGREDRLQHQVSVLAAVDPPVRVVIFTSNDDERKLFEALRLGVSGYLLESTASRSLADSLVRARNGEPVIDSRIGTRVATQVAAEDGWSSPGAELGLSRREGEVLELLVSGCSNRQIADELVLGPETVKTHLRSIYRKLGVASRAQAVARAIRHGMSINGQLTRRLTETGAFPISAPERDGAMAEAGPADNADEVTAIES